ncbi:MAG: transglycosylase SLT domain-containing protein [Gallionella sp.]|nr:transglycosylase SLT domain-containing protein [Gallionella sp.]
MRRFLLLLTCLFLSFGAQADTDEDFLQLREAYRKGDAAQLAKFQRRLKGSPLEIYGRYYALRLTLKNVDTKAVTDFLAQPEDSPVIDRLRGEWLKELAKNQDWAAFEAEYPRLINEDTELACYHLQFRQSKPDNSVDEAVRKLWLTGKTLPDNCAPVFAAAIAEGALAPQDLWQRMRLALEAGNLTLAKALAPLLQGEQTISPEALDAAGKDAEGWLDQAPPPRTEGARAVTLFALGRLSKQSPDLALARWNTLSADFPPDEQRYFYSWLGYEAARKQDVRALGWYLHAGKQALTEQQSAWRVRAALRLQNWDEVLNGIQSMGMEQQADPTWRYWKARALLGLNKPLEARRLLAPLSGEFHFYGQLAREELGSMPTLENRPDTFKPSEKDIKAMLAVPGVQRTLALYRMDLRADALKEWSWTVRNFNDRELLTAAEIARRNEMYDRAIGAASLTVNEHDFGLRYLAPYREVLQSHIQENGLEEAWVYGLMRQESRFVSSAKSKVGAAGLMQIMPATARWVARKLGLKSYRNNLIHQLDTNLKLGTYYMKTVLNWFDDSPVLASAAYNAGPGRARRWRGDQPLEGAIYAETIPFEETRDYVKKVMSNTAYYAEQFDAPPRTLKQRLGVVTPKTPENQQAIPDER